MKKINHLRAAIILAAILFLAIAPVANAQVPYQLSDSPEIAVKISGKSNIHDWAMTSVIMQTRGKFKFNGNNLNDVTKLNFSLAAKSLKNDHKTMDSRTYKLLNADKYPIISYRLSSATVSPLKQNKYLIKAKGELTIAGVTRTVSMDVTAIVNGDNTITCSGAENIQLTDYGMKPPTFMLGAMKVYNDLVIQFNLIYKA